MQQDSTGEILFREGGAPTPEFIREYKKWKPLYSGAMKTARTRFEILDDEFSMIQGHDPIHSIQTRLKTVESAYEKLARRGFAQVADNLTQLKDIAGVRVICSYVEDVYDIADVFLRQEGVVLLQKKDDIENPKPNGYRSLHLIVAVPIFLAHEKRTMRVEIQLRTIAMDFWASLEHQLRYKKDVDFTDEMAKDLKFCAELSAELDRRMDALREQVQEESK
jgi:putative GTP pyrophosphokinase